jgi:glycosyltransferase involved in cell wall biosynthesis
MHPSVSIIIPTYNRAEFLRKAISSVLDQTYPNYELIVVDDGSEDHSEGVVSSFRWPIRYLRQENRGPAAARNTGIQAAQSEFIAFLDSDDCFAKNKLALQVAAMAENPDCLISHTEEVWFRRGEHLNQKKRHRKASGDIFAQSLELCAVGMSTVMVRRGLFELEGLFDEELPCCEDYDLWLRVSARHSFLLVDQPLTVKAGGRPDQVSFEYRVGMDRFRIRAIEKIIASGRLTAAQHALAVAELIRKCTIYGKGCLKHQRSREGEEYLALARRYLPAGCSETEIFNGLDGG